MADNTTPWWVSFSEKPGTGMSNSNTNLSISSGPAYDRVSSIPSWLPTEGNQQALETYQNIPRMFDTSSFDQTSQTKENQAIATGINAGNNAATDYANRARQAGGNGMGAGLVKAQAVLGGKKQATDLALEREKFDASQREKAASLSGQIAQTIGQLRTAYLGNIVNYATNEDKISSDNRNAALNLAMEQKKLDESARQFNWTRPNSGGYETDNLGKISDLFGQPFRDPRTGLPSNNIAFAPTNRESNTAGGIFG